MNLFNGLFGGHGDYNKGGDNDCWCTLILIWLLLSKCGCGFNICELFTCENIKLIILIYLLISMCGNSHDNCGCRG